MTTDQLLRGLLEACDRSLIVLQVEERVVDADVLAARAHLAIAETFINVFYNLATDKTAFALVSRGQRVYGVDNAKMGWHRHPFSNPDQHVSCAPVSFAEFLAEVEAYYG